MKNIKRLFRKRELIVILIILCFIYPLINLLRGFPFRLLSFSMHAREIIFFLSTIFLLTNILYFFHRRISASSWFSERVALCITVEILFILVYTPFITFTIYWILFPKYFSTSADLRTITFFTIILYFIQWAYLFYYHFSDYLARFRKAVISQEQLKFEIITNRYQALQNHISPHFIFNCLSGLNVMIHKDPAVASEIVYNLSDCLRHILTTLDKVTIPLSTELSFMHRYLYLLDIRSPGYIEVVENISEEDKHKRIPPCLLQMLIENAVKHNTISAEKKLTISITSMPHNKLEVSNNIIRKWNQELTAGTGTGLDNMVQRYSLLADDPISISIKDERFTVVLPLLDKPSYENTHY
ncbi:MAG TPA: histidine kinase [Chitinophagaceae bacterium]